MQGLEGPDRRLAVQTLKHLASRHDQSGVVALLNRRQGWRAPGDLSRLGRARIRPRRSLLWGGPRLGWRLRLGSLSVRLM